MAHDISDFTEGERRDLFASLKAYFGEPDSFDRLFEKFRHEGGWLADDERFVAKRIIVKGTQTIDTIFAESEHVSQMKLDAFMAGYFAGVRDTDNQNAEDILEEYEGDLLCSDCNYSGPKSSFDDGGVVECPKVQKHASGTTMILKGHTEECTESLCYCYDKNYPDPMCDCGNPGFACACPVQPVQEFITSSESI